jgi:hypothetical protein
MVAPSANPLQLCQAAGLGVEQANEYIAERPLDSVDSVRRELKLSGFLQ